MHTAAKITKAVVDFGLVCLVVVALVYTLGALGGVLDGPDDVQAAQDTEASLSDALAQAQAEHPDLWDTEQKERARVAVRLVTQGVTP